MAEKPPLKTNKLKKKQLTESSRRWILRQLNDPYVHAAKAKGYRSRAAFKLLEIDEAHHILKPGLTAVDLGAAPGGWSQVLLEKLHPSRPNQIVAIDILDMAPLPKVLFKQMDFSKEEAPEDLKALLGSTGAHLVISDIAPPTTGHKKTDHLRIMTIVEEAFAFAEEVLLEDGVFLAKVFQGGTETALLKRMKMLFKKVVHVKPKASRKESSEMYVLAIGFKGSKES